MPIPMLPRDKDLSGSGFGSRRNYASSAESPFMSLRFITFVGFTVMIRAVEKENPEQSSGDRETWRSAC
jgi:hypothetical protein